VWCSLWGTDWIVKYYLDELWLQRIKTEGWQRMRNWKGRRNRNRQDVNHLQATAYGYLNIPIGENPNLYIEWISSQYWHLTLQCYHVRHDYITCGVNICFLFYPISHIHIRGARNSFMCSIQTSADRWWCQFYNIPFACFHCHWFDW
jgi:hypothetical protein